MAKSEEQELSDLLETCVLKLHSTTTAEVQTLGQEMCNRLAFHFADAIAQSCAQLHSEKLHLQQQLNGVTKSCDSTLQKDSNTTAPPSHAATGHLSDSDGSSLAPLICAPLQDGPVPNSARLGVPQLKLASIKSSEDEDTTPCVVNMNGLSVNANLLSSRSDDKSAASALTVHTHQCIKDSRGVDKEDDIGPRKSSKLWGRISEYSGSPKGRYAAFVYRIVNSRLFEGFFNLVIVLNCFTMGIETTQIMHHNDLIESILQVGEHILTALFLLELILRMQVFGWRSFIPGLSKSKDVALNFMDVFLVVVTGVLFSWVIPLLAVMFNFSTENDIVKALTVLRAVRLLRLVRVFQRVPAFREAWLLLRGLTDSVRTLFWTCFVIMFITYIFAIFGMVGITKPLYEKQQDIDDPDRYDQISELLEFVGGLDLLMITLIQLLTMDSWNFFLRKMLKELPYCWAYFYSYIAVAVFVLMNLVTAIIVNNALDNAKVDEEHIVKQKEKAKKDELRGLEDLFERMDTDGSGTLNWQEFKDSFADPEMTKKWKLLDFEPDECKELFSLLDDGDGEIETLEFFEGLAKMKGSAQSKDIFRLQKTMISLSNALLDEHKSLRTGQTCHMTRSKSTRTLRNSPTFGGPSGASSKSTTPRSPAKSPRSPSESPRLPSPEKDLQHGLRRHIHDLWNKLSQERIDVPIATSSSPRALFNQIRNITSVPDTSTPSKVMGTVNIIEGVGWLTPTKLQSEEGTPRMPTSGMFSSGGLHHGLTKI